jgi:hypothetical protein
MTDTERETTMLLQRGDILVERLTGKRVMVIDVPAPDEVTCRFSDGRLEGRFMCEVAIPQRSLLESFFSYAQTFLFAPQRTQLTSVTTEGRPRLARQNRQSPS